MRVSSGNRRSLETREEVAGAPLMRSASVKAPPGRSRASRVRQVRAYPGVGRCQQPSPLARLTSSGHAAERARERPDGDRHDDPRSASTLAVLLLTVLWLPAASGWADPVAAPAPGSAAPNFALTTQQNDRLWLTQLRGRAVVLAFGCTTCGACPDVVARLKDVAQGLGDAPGRRVFFALVTVDPAHDSATVLRSTAAPTASAPPRGFSSRRIDRVRRTSLRTASASTSGGSEGGRNRAAR